MKNHFKILMFSILTILFVSFGSGFDFIETESTHAGVGDNIRGYAWSDNIGWISFNSLDGGGSDYGVNLDLTTKLLSGHAWSDNVGWLSFNGSDLSGCPQAPCTAKWTQGSGAISGWARFLSADNNGWDGWLSLGGHNQDLESNVSLSGTSLNGYAWGDEVVGWVSFSGTNYGVTVGVPSTETICSDGIDDDLDGLTDCADNDCSLDPICNPPFFNTSSGNDIFVTILGAQSSAESSETTLTISPENGFTGDVVFSIDSGLPAGATANFTPDNLLTTGEYSSGLTFSVTVPNTVDSGVYAITVKAVGGGFTGQIAVQLNVNKTSPVFEEI